MWRILFVVAVVFAVCTPPAEAAIRAKAKAKTKVKTGVVAPLRPPVPARTKVNVRMDEVTPTARAGQFRWDFWPGRRRARSA